MLLKGKTILITGASKGIGLAIARLFAKEGANLILASRNVHALNLIKNDLPVFATNHIAIETDVSDTESIKALFNHLTSNKILIHGLVNNAGVMRDSALLMVKPEVVMDTFNTNVNGTIFTSQLAIKSLIRNKGGFIINMASIIGVSGSAGQTIYSSSKSAIIGFTKSLSKELAPLNIRVNAIAPGFISTDLTAHLQENINEKNLNSIGMKRFGQPEDVANLALFLASDLSSYITGQVIGVDGGMVI